MRVRAAVAGDVPAVHALEALVFGPDAWSVESVRDELAGPGRTAVVACHRGVVGYAVARAAAGGVDLHRVVVHPAQRRRGLAHALLGAVWRRTAADRMLLEVSAANAGALAFYETEGFIEVHRRHRYYRDGTDAVVMAAQCTDRS